MAVPQKEANPEVKPADAEKVESAAVEVAQPAPEAVETTAEQQEQREQRAEQAEEETTKAAQAEAQKQAAQQAAVRRPEKDQMTRQIEGVLQDGLMDMYKELPPDTQTAFREKGEETASKIRTMLKEAKVQAKKIFELIKEWLGILPHVNRYYLIQEAKIKTDNILTLAGQERGEEEDTIA